VTFDDWILALHVLSAFAMVGAIVLFWILIVAIAAFETRLVAGGRLRLPRGKPRTGSRSREGRRVGGGNRRFHPPHNDHGLHTREPAIGRQIQGPPLALR
jgi:hypothetical protein